MKKIILFILLCTSLFAQRPGKAIIFSDFTDALWSDIKDTMDARSGNTIQVIDYGATGDGVTDDAAAIQSAIDAAVAGDVIYFPRGTYMIKSEVWIDTDTTLTIVGAGKYSTTIKFDTSYTSSSFDGLYIHDSDGIEIYNMGFSAIDYYPTDDTLTSNLDVDSLNTGIRIVNSSNIDIHDSYFNGFTYSSIHLTADGDDNNCNDITIQNNIFDKGAWQFKVIAIYAADGVDLEYDNTDLYNVKVLNNKINKFGTQKILYPGTSDKHSGAAIHLDNLRNSSIVGNQIDSCSGIGIRLEQSERCAVTHNIVTESGASGIIIYGNAYDNTIVGNVVNRFGRLPDNSKLVEYEGEYYNPVVYMAQAGSFKPPNNPAVADSGFEVYKYVITGETDSIPTYDSTVASIVPNRGGCGIWLGQRSARNTVAGNSVKGDTSTAGGKYNYMCEYGISVGWHPNNAPVSGSGDCALSGNVVSTVINSTQEIYLAQYAEDYVSGGSTYQAGAQTASTQSGNNATVDNWDNPYSYASFFKTNSSDSDTVTVNSSGVRVTNGTNNVFFQVAENGQLTFAGDTVLVGTNGSGVYKMSGNLSFKVTHIDTCEWQIGFRKNSAGIGRGYADLTISDSLGLKHVSFQWFGSLVAGDVISIHAKQYAGGNRDFIPIWSQVDIWRIDE